MLDLDAEAMYRTLLSRAREQFTGASLHLVGILTGGVWLAERLRHDLGVEPPVGVLDVSFYRDDFDRSGLNPTVQPSRIPFDVADAHILLVDDVLYTGRTTRAAMNELFDYGRPRRIDLAVLVDRGGRELPVAPTVMGAHIEVPASVSIVLTRDADQRFHLTMENAE